MKSHHIVLLITVLVILAYANFLYTETEAGAPYRLVPFNPKKNTLERCVGNDLDEKCAFIEVELKKKSNTQASQEK